MKMVSVTRMLSTLCLNKQHADCPGGLDGIECQCACHKTAPQPMLRGGYPSGDTPASEIVAPADALRPSPRADLDDMGFA